MIVDDQPRGFLGLVIILLLFGFTAAVFVLAKKQEPQSSKLANSSFSNGRVFTIEYANGVFSPTNISIQTGDAIVFKNSSKSLLYLDSADENFGDQPVLAGDQLKHVFNKTGLVRYQNKQAQQEHGSITINE